MSDDEDYNSEEDLDYVPSDGEQVSEEENSGDEEDLTLLQDGETQVKPGSVRKKSSGKKKLDVIEARKRKGGIRLNDEEKDQDQAVSSSKEETNGDEARRKLELEEQILQEQEQKKEEREKKRADDLWSSFMADVKKPPSHGSQSGPSGAGLGSLSSPIKSSPKSNVESRPNGSSKISEEKPGKVTITKVFDFAGEEIKITKEVDADSKEAKAEQKKQQEKMDKEKEEATISQTQSLGLRCIPSALKRPSAGGLGSVLNKISKKNKMGTLEKSKLDWNSFKEKEGIEEDLKIHNKGKQGYTERMAFLNRADQRQFEIERDLRLGKNSKR